MDAPIEIIAPDSGRPFRAFAHAGDGFPVYWHRHAEYELVCSTTAGGECRVADAVERPADPRALLLGPHVPHSWAMEGPYEHLVVQFHRDWLGSGFLANTGCQGLADLLARSASGLVLEGPAALAIALQVRGLLATDGIAAIAGMLVCLDAFAAGGPRPMLVGGPPAGYDARLQAVLDWIARHAAEDIALDDVAATAEMHPKAFARYFRKASGHSFLGYLGHLRVHRACLRLRDGDEQVTDIALGVGFGTVASFNRLFLRLRRMTPTAYRQKFSTVGRSRQARL